MSIQEEKREGPRPDHDTPESPGRYVERRLREGGLRLVSGSPTMLSDEFARYEAERIADRRPD